MEWNCKLDSTIFILLFNQSCLFDIAMFVICRSCDNQRPSILDNKPNLNAFTNCLDLGIGDDSRMNAA